MAKAPRFEVYERADNDFGWRLIARNGQIVATSGEGYATAEAASLAKTNVVRLVGETGEDSEAGGA